MPVSRAIHKDVQRFDIIYCFFLMLLGFIFEWDAKFADSSLLDEDYESERIQMTSTVVPPIKAIT